jgi:hypothetical protein
MKKLAIFLALCITIVVGAFIYAAVNANTLAQKFKPDLERIASEALHAPLTLGTLEASVFPDARIQVREFSLGSGTPQETLSLRDLTIHVKLVPLIFGSLEIEEISLYRPNLVLEKSADGITIVGLPKTPKSKTTVTQNERSITSNQTASAPPQVPSALKLTLKTLALEDAIITIKDTVNDTATTIQDLDLTVGVTFADTTVTLAPFTLSAELPAKTKIEISSTPIRYSLKDTTLTLDALTVKLPRGELALAVQYHQATSKGKVKISSSGIELSPLVPLITPFAPQIATFNLSGAVAPQLDVSLNSGAFNVDGSIALKDIAAQANTIAVAALTGTLHLTATPERSTIKTDDLKLALNNKPVEIAMRANVVPSRKAELERCTITAFEGRTELSGTLDLSGAQRFSTKLLLEKIAIQEALSAVKPELAALASGTIKRVNASIGGTLGEHLQQSLLGDLSLEIGDAQLLGINFIAEVLQKVNELPFMRGSLYDALPPEEAQALKGNNTIIDELSGNVTIADGSLRTKNLTVRTPQTVVLAQGTADFDGTLDLSTSVVINQTISAALVKKVRELAYATDNDGRLTIPVLVKGRSPKLLVLPNLERLIELAAKRALKENASSLLSEALSGKKGSKGLGGLLGF